MLPKRETESRSSVSLSKGMLLPDHVLMLRHQTICKQLLETPEVSEVVISESQNMSFSSQPAIDRTQSYCTQQEYDGISPTNRMLMTSRDIKKLGSVHDENRRSSMKGFPTDNNNSESYKLPR